MLKIKFSHYYDKMPYVKKYNVAILLEVFKVKKEDLSEAFITYDTKYVNSLGNYSYYSLPSSDFLLVLLFKVKDHGALFTTIRSWTEKKENYYRQNRGQEFEIVIRDKNWIRWSSNF